MRDRLRWRARGAPLDDEQWVTLAYHVEHWHAEVPGYALYAPRARDAELQLYGELMILERVTVRGPVSALAGRVLDALSELAGLVPGVDLTIATDEVVFLSTPMGFERRARVSDDEILARPTDWIPVSDLVPFARPIRSLADEARVHARPLLEPPPPASGFRDLDWDDDTTARARVEAIFTRAMTAAALVLVAKLRDRPRSEVDHRVFDRTIEMLGIVRTSSVAPTLVLVVEGTPARGQAWCDAVIATIAADERTRADAPAVRAALAEGSSFALSADRRAALRAFEADDVAEATRDMEAARQWMERNRERIDELKRAREPEPA